jgi:hypothetical protein
MTIPVTRMSELSTGAQLIMWATRHLVAAAIRDAGVPWSVERSFQIADASSAYEALQRLIVTIARNTNRQLTVAGPSSGVLTADEVLLAAALVDDAAVEPDAASGTGLSAFGETAVRQLRRLRAEMDTAGLPTVRLGMPEARHLVSGRAPALHANPGMADLH